jgi:hypothetical protein
MDSGCVVRLVMQGEGGESFVEVAWELSPFILGNVLTHPNRE